ncbi:MAG: 2Fe-2S iron-sulfur cluster binding domain-containing protein [Rhizobiales bacterium]|nr:2Fe-2S iron-sulfur cluster binding domain-containing protein [Hyphomicrobiales bacterium]
MATITILNKGLTIDAPAGQTILDTALNQGIDYPFGCHSGMCGACKSRLIAGSVELRAYSDFALSDEEREAGLILACRSVPQNDCIVIYDDDLEAPGHPLRTLEARVVEAQPATHDILILKLEMPPDVAPFAFSAGQFASLMFPGAPARDYSMANRPNDGLLTFHIRHMPGGIVSPVVHAGSIVGSPVTVRGPFGTSYLRRKHSGPILCVAGGSGLAPMLSIIEEALQCGIPQQIVLYFGVRDERDLYLIDHLDQLAGTHANFSYIPVLSAVTGPTTRRTGTLADAISTDFASLEGWKVYLAGPPIMAETVITSVAARGVQPADRHADPFYTAADQARLVSSA